MININLTLIAQLFHFCVAYFLIKSLFLKPLIQIINGDDSYIGKLQESVARAESEKESHQQLNVNFWAKAQRSFAKLRPTIEPEFVRSTVSFKAPHITPSEIKQEQDALTHAIAKSWEQRDA